MSPLKEAAGDRHAPCGLRRTAWWGRSVSVSPTRPTSTSGSVAGRPRLALLIRALDRSRELTGQLGPQDVDGRLVGRGDAASSFAATRRRFSAWARAWEGPTRRAGQHATRPPPGSRGSSQPQRPLHEHDDLAADAHSIALDGGFDSARAPHLDALGDLKFSHAPPLGEHGE